MASGVANKRLGIWAWCCPTHGEIRRQANTLDGWPKPRCPRRKCFRLLVWQVRTPPTEDNEQQELPW